MNEPIYCTTHLHHLSPEGAVPVGVDIGDARASERQFSFWTNGFECRRIPSSVTDWSDQQSIDSRHYAEIRNWSREFTECDKVLFFPAILRTPSAAKKDSDYAPIEFAHSDYTEGYADMIKDCDHPYHAILKPYMAQEALSDEDLKKAKRVLTLQLWRNVGPALMDHPLAVCDATSVPRNQLSPFRVERYGGVESQFDSFVLTPPEPSIQNRWYCYKEMLEDEVLVFRAFDSECVEKGTPFWTPHSAFKDPHSSGIPRSSVEMRAICLYF